MSQYGCQYSKYVSLRKLLFMLRDPLHIAMEDREKLGYRTYGIKNQAEFPTLLNRSDNDPWDVILPGYKKRIRKKHFCAHVVIGILYVSNGNHKLFMRIPYPGYSSKQAKIDMNVYKAEYSRQNPQVGTRWSHTAVVLLRK